MGVWVGGWVREIERAPTQPFRSVHQSTFRLQTGPLTATETGQNNIAVFAPKNKLRAKVHSSWLRLKSKRGDWGQTRCDTGEEKLTPRPSVQS